MKYKLLLLLLVACGAPKPTKTVITINPDGTSKVVTKYSGKDTTVVNLNPDGSLKK